MRSRVNLTIEQTKKLQRENDKADSDLVLSTEVREVAIAANKVVSNALEKACTSKLARVFCDLDEPAHVRELLKIVVQGIRKEVSSEWLSMSRKGG
jgi:hypothetical protein